MDFIAFKTLAAELEGVLDGTRKLATWDTRKVCPGHWDYVHWHVDGDPYDPNGVEVRSRPMISEDGELSTEVMVGKPEDLDTYRNLGALVIAGDLNLTAYVLMVGALHGYPKLDSVKWAIDNEDGKICNCTQCVPRVF